LLAIEAREVDAFSVWHKGTPFVFLNTIKSAEHSRFDAAHELAHLVHDSHSTLHGEAHSPDMERQANAFASAFLMPRDSIIAYKHNFPTLSQLIELKRVWGVSLAALAYRMNQLSLLTEWSYRNLCIQLATHGYRTKEPSPMGPEASQMLTKVFDALRAEGLHRSDIARELSLLQEDIDNLTFCLATSAVSSQATGEAKNEAVKSSKSPKRLLHLVK
jgi:Zn-dependent peptidase ImmA (M78 family)